MACNSLFAYEAIGVTTVISTNSFNCSGNFSVGGYTTPGWTTTTTVPAISHWNAKNVCIPSWTPHCNSNYTSTCTNSGILCAGITTYNNCTSTTNACAGTTEVYTETFTHPTNKHVYSGIQLWPVTNITGSANINIKTTASEEIVIPPPGGVTPLTVGAVDITVSNLNITFSVGSESIPINIPISSSITLEVNSAGSFDAMIPIPGATFTDTQTNNISGIGNVTYGFSGSAYILLCATPVPPVNYVNIVFDSGFSVSCNNPITSEPISFNTNFSVLCPAMPEV